MFKDLSTLMYYNFTSVSELNSSIRKIKLSASKLESEYKNISEMKDLEEKITSSYLLLDRCYMGIQEAKWLQNISKPNAQVLSSARKAHSNLLNKVLAGLEKISEEVKPESYVKDLEKISTFIKEVPLRTSIFPKEDSIIIYSIFPYNSGFLIFSTAYTENSSQRYLSTTSEERVLPGKYSLGSKVEKVEDFFANGRELIPNILKEANVLPRNKVRAKVREGMNLVRAKSLLCSTFNGFIKDAMILDDNIIVSFNKLRDSEVKLIANVLKLNSNDKYLMLSMQGE